MRAILHFTQSNGTDCSWQEQEEWHWISWHSDYSMIAWYLSNSIPPSFSPDTSQLSASALVLSSSATDLWYPFIHFSPLPILAPHEFLKFQQRRINHRWFKRYWKSNRSADIGERWENIHCGYGSNGRRGKKLAWCTHKFNSVTWRNESAINYQSSIVLNSHYSSFFSFRNAPMSWIPSMVLEKWFSSNVMSQAKRR